MFTSAESKEQDKAIQDELGNLFTEVRFFPDMSSHDGVEIAAVEMHDRYRFTNVVALSEADLLRAASLRERFGIDGPGYEQILPFRDKGLMKDMAQRRGVPVAEYCRVSNTTQLLDFIDQVGYPVVVKPLLGRGSANTYVIRSRDDLEQKAGQGIFPRTFGNTELLAEKFLFGEICHIDGLVLDGEIQVISPARYVNNCLNFVGGAFLGSYTLSDDNALCKRLKTFAADLVENVYPMPSNSLFHIETFVTPANDIVLCEIACRLGGNGINEEVRLSRGVDMKWEYLKREMGVSAAGEGVQRPSTGRLGGRLLIPPRDGVLVHTPQDCPVRNVSAYRNVGVPGARYEPMKMSNDEIASFLFHGSTEEEMLAIIGDLNGWFEKNTQWDEERCYESTAG